MLLPFEYKCIILIWLSDSHAHTQAGAKNNFDVQHLWTMLWYKTSQHPPFSPLSPWQQSLWRHPPLTFTWLSRLQSESEYRWRRKQHLFIHTLIKQQHKQQAQPRFSNNKCTGGKTQKTNCNHCDYVRDLNRRTEDSEQGLLSGDRQTGRRAAVQPPTHDALFLWAGCCTSTNCKTSGFLQVVALVAAKL